ncbi:TonB-dependent receptor plug domain-containing protein [Pedobacter sp. MW01-1-1]|uniref:TonB-dependent receptor plug domain-containing protein n=1 Tax=Pedobacter sp. MW01-1-1 TaxID=3383027 RepID=UPI003FEDFC25
MRIYLSIALLFCCILADAQEIKIDTTKAKDLEDVVVTGQYEPQSLRKSVYNVRVINDTRIRLSAANNVQQVLNTELGFRFSNDLTLGTTDVQLMGMSGRNVKILLDGVPMVDRSDTRESLNQIDINTIERIEIVEGPMSVVYGSDALAGVINIITKKNGKSMLNVSARLQEETVGNEYNFLNGAGNHVQNLGLAYQNKGWSASIGGTHNEFGGWNVPAKATTIDEVSAISNYWKPKEQWMGNAKLGYRTKNFNIWYRFDGLDEVIDSRTGMNPNNYKERSQSYTTNRYSQQLQSELRINSKLQLNGILSYSDLARKTETKIYDYTTGVSALTDGAGEQDVAKFNNTLFRATAQYVISPIASIQPGIEYSRDAASGARINGSPVIQDYAFFVSSEINLTKSLQIRPGLRFIKNSIYDAPPVIPSLNAKIVLSEQVDFRLGYAKGFRAPALRELYYDFIDASHKILGNPNLKAEESNSFNGSFAWNPLSRKDIHFRSTLTGFYNQFKNRIEFGQDPVDNSITTLINISTYKTTGGTLDNTLKYKNLHANLGISYIGRYNQIYENDSFDVPQFVWATEVTSTLSYLFTKLNASVSLFYKYTGSLPAYQLQSSNNVASAQLVKTGSFNWADLMLNKTFYKYFALNMGIKNLFNVTQLSNTGTASGGAHSTGGGAVPYANGRSYVLGLSFNWNKI